MKKQVAKLRAEFEQCKDKGLSDHAYAKKGNSSTPSMKELHATIQNYGEQSRET
jgi:hypothetical protein